MKKTVLGLSPGLLMAIVFISGIVPIVLLAAPAIAAQFSSQLGLAPGQIGLLFGAENAAMSLASIPAFFWQKRWNWRKVGLAAAICFILANIASYFAMAFQPLLLLRLVSGLGGGTLMVMCLSSAALSPQKDRVYGLWVCGQLVVGAVALWILPILFSHFGLGAFYLALALLLALCLPLISYFPGMIEQPAPGAIKPTKGKRDYLALAGILAILAFYIGLSGVWSFMGTVAQGAGIDPEATGRVLAMASIVGIFGSLAVALFGGRIPRGLSLLVGYSVLTLSIIGLLGVPGVLRFGMAAFAFKLIWTSLLPLILGVVAERDRDGRLMGSVNLCIGAGLTIGPATAGQLIQFTGNMTIVLWGSAALLQLSFLFILMCRRTGSGALQTAIKPAT